MWRNNELLTCPFCGSENVSLFSVPADNRLNWIVGCSDCGARTRECFNEEEATECWDERHICKPAETMSQEIEALEKQLKPCKFCGSFPMLFTANRNGDTLYLIHCSLIECWISTPIFADFNEARDFWNDGVKEE